MSEKRKAALLDQQPLFSEEEKARLRQLGQQDGLEAQANVVETPVVEEETGGRHSISAIGNENAVSVADLQAKMGVPLIEIVKPIEVVSLDKPISLAKPEVNVTTEVLVDSHMPKGFPTLEQAKEDVESVDPVRLGFWKRACLAAGAPGRLVWKGYSKLFDRALTKSQMYQSMTPEQQRKLKKRSAIISTLAAIGIGTAYGLTKSEQILSLLPGHESSGGDQPNRIRGHEEYNTNGLHTSEFTYDAAKDPLLQQAGKTDQYNFGTPLAGATPEEKLQDLMNNNWKRSPQSLASAMAAMGLIPLDNDSVARTASDMMANPQLMSGNFHQVEQFVHNSQLGSADSPFGYSSFMAVNNGNGASTVALQSYVPESQKMLTLVNSQTGQTCNFGEDCAQAIFILPEQPAAPQVSYAVPVQTANVETVAYEQEWHPEAPVVPEQPVPPVINIPSVPTLQIPGLPPIVIPQIPGITAPPSPPSPPADFAPKTNHFTDLDRVVPLGADPHPKPVPNVHQEAVPVVPARPNVSVPRPDNSMKPLGTESGIQRPGSGVPKPAAPAPHNIPATGLNNNNNHVKPQ